MGTPYEPPNMSCCQCQGFGEVRDYSGDEPRMVVCPSCHGSGVTPPPIPQPTPQRVIKANNQ